MLIFWRLLFGHLLADFTFQTNFINRWKRSSQWGMLAHCLTHPVVYAAMTWPYLGETWVELPGLALTGWACILIVFVAHYIEDQWRVFTIFKHHTPDNTLYFIWDQIIHYAVIFAVIPVGLRGSNINLMPEKWPLLGICFVLVTHACTVLIYFVEKDLRNRAYPDTDEKYLGMAERLVFSGLLLVPGHLWPLLALGWFSFMNYVRVKRLIDMSRISLYVGAAVALLCGLAARFVYYA
jgi:hypothetical protein